MAVEQMRRSNATTPDDPDVQIIAWTAAPGSTSRERLARLRILA